ncbi:ribonuclease P protein subunit [Candidatus Woesearchaeota archaeon]|nr:ribonuclease P protein subunit [Candidatus Woesearchaeota archaeon]
MDKAGLLKGELIGLNVKVLGKNIEGRIIDETKNMLMIEQDLKKKKIIKSSNEFEVEFKNQKVKIDGKLLVGRCEERIKKIW